MANSDIQAYLTEIGRHPVLSKEAQLRHCYRIWEWVHHPAGRDKAPSAVVRAGRRSMDVMIRTNLRLVVAVAKKYQHRGLDLCDLIQEGNFGLIRGLELFDPTRGYSVTTYAYWWIRQSVTRAIYTFGRPVRMPINTHETLSKAQRFAGEYLAHHGTTPSIAQIADAVNVTPERLSTILDVFDSTHCYSLDQPIPNNDSAPTTALELLEAPPSPEPAEDLSLALTTLLTTLQQNLLFEEALTYLDPREAYIIRAIYYDERPICDLAQTLELSRSRVRQIQSKALMKLRFRFADLHQPEAPLP